ncbi:MAG: alginate export family protein [Candidatus Omnitrophota bacterium]|nr:alginate export family protein [Candidatus Omnitrophota bacterium]
MSKKLILLAAVLTVALIGSTFAAVENIKVSGDINEQYVLRDLHLGQDVNPVPGHGRNYKGEQYLLSQVRLRFDANLTENVSGTVRLLDERTWGEEDTFSDNSSLDLDLGYIEMKEFLYEPLTIIVGRLILRYGSALFVGDPDTNAVVGTTAITNHRFGDLSLRKSFDATRIILDFSPFTIDGIYAKVNAPTTDQKDNINLWGVNAAYQWGSFEGITEGYYFGAQGNRDGIDYELRNTIDRENQRTTHVLGFRTQFNPIEKLTLGGEGAYQFGNVHLNDGLGNAYQHLSAWAIEANAEYRFMTKYNPKVGLNYVYLSGGRDKTTNDHYSGWDPMFEDQSLGEIANLLFPNSNVQAAKVSASMMPREDITLGISYTFLRLAELLNCDTITYNPPLTANWYHETTYNITPYEGYLGSEIDAMALYDYTEDVQLKLTGAWFIPGDFFADTNDGVAYSVRTGVNLNF